MRRYYDHLNNKIKEELAKKDKQAKLKENSDIEIISKEEIEKPKEGNELVRIEELKEIDEELEIIDENELEKQSLLPQTMMSIPDSQFPLFLTLRRLLLMIDGTIKRPFFSRNSKGDIIGLEGNADWHNETKGVMMINSNKKYDNQDESLSNKLETEDPNKLINEIEKEGVEEATEEDEADNDEVEEDGKAKKCYFMAREVDFDIFSRKFWPTTIGKIQTGSQSQRKLFSPASVWREIQTNIKGCVEAHEFATHYVPLTRFQKLFTNKTTFPPDLQPLLYEIFYLYERWAWENNYYDQSDLVNHILSQIKWNGYHGQPIHFIMCDEVQDLPPAALLLLLKLAEQNLFFSGDTAQTIAQGVSFRFSDLKNLFANVNLPSGMPAIMQMSINFRSHAKILDLANSVVRALELLFPNSIDKLRKEKSPVDGLKPIVLESELKESLFNFLLGPQKEADTNQEKLLTRPPLEFGCDQAIIVRNQQAKDNLPSFLKHALCLTIYETKGLEFDDVILYNFFTNSEVPEDWKLLKFLKVEEKKIPTNKNKEGEHPQTFDDLENKQWLLPEEDKLQEDKEFTIIKSITTNIKKDGAQGKYSALTSELKHLYTAITRPRKRLIIFDENPDIRKPMLNYWMSLGYVQIITKEKLSEKTADETIKNLVENLSGVKTSQKGWRAQGIRMFRRRYYLQAMKCFEHSGDALLHLRAEAYYHASIASDLQTEIDSLNSTINIPSNTKQDKREIAEKIELLKKRVDESFMQAGILFDKLDLKKQAGQCYFSVQNYKKAAECFEIIGSYGQAGEACFKLGEFLKAGELYEKGGVPSNAIVAYAETKNWELVLNCIHNFRDKLPEDHRLKLVKKYIQIAINAMFQEYEAAQAQTTQIVATAPKVEDQLDSASEKNDASINKLEDSSYNPFEVEEPEEDKKSEFSLVDTPPEKQIDENHISGLNPEDEWIQCETGSIIDSVVSGKITVSNKSSDYSMIDNQHAFAFNCSLVRTKRDIFVEDQMMAKIIRYISYFSEEVQKNLEILRSKAALLHKKQENVEIQENVNAGFLVDMDEIDIPFVNLLLDVLENLGLFKLCIIICNRYQITDRISRYIVSISHQYSNIKVICDAFERFETLQNNTYREIQLKNSIIANAAVHGVFEVVNPEFLKMKKYMEIADETNSLGVYFNRCMLLLGYWRKLVYIVDCENSLAITSTFADYYNYKLIYLINFGNVSKQNVANIQTIVQTCGFNWLPFKTPTTPLEIQAMYIALDSVLFELNRILKITIFNPLATETLHFDKLPEFPSIMQCNYVLWKYLFSPNNENFEDYERVMKAACNEFINFDREKMVKVGKELFIKDFCSALIQLIFSLKENATAKNLILKLNSSLYNSILNCIYKIVSIVHSGKTKNIYSDSYYEIYLSILASFGIRRIEGKDFRMGYGKQFLIHKSNFFFDKAVKIAVQLKSIKDKEVESKVMQQMPKFLTMDSKAFNELLQQDIKNVLESQNVGKL